MKLEEKISALRKDKGWSQEQFAFELDVSRQAVSKWETGVSVPDLDKIIKMSDLFGVTIDYLLMDETLQSQNEQTIFENSEISENLEKHEEKISTFQRLYNKKISLFSTVYWICVAVLYAYFIFIKKGGWVKSGFLWIAAFGVEFLIFAVVRAIACKPTDEKDRKAKIKNILGDLTGAYWSFVCLWISAINLRKWIWGKTAIIFAVAAVLYGVAFLVARFLQKRIESK